jgi:serine/threonine protein kinase
VANALVEQGGHPNIIETFEHGWLKGRGSVYFIDMELANCSLQDHINALHMRKTGPTVTPTESPGDLSFSGFHERDQGLAGVWDIGIQLCAAIEFLHGHGHVHRDIKPDNGDPPSDILLI